MTFDDDYCQFVLALGVARVSLKQLNLEWPPPMFIEIVDRPDHVTCFKQTRMSTITDEQRARMTHVCRGAEYVHATDEEVQRFAAGLQEPSPVVQ